MKRPMLWLRRILIGLAVVALFWWVAETAPMIPAGYWDWMR